MKSCVQENVPTDLLITANNVQFKDKRKLVQMQSTFSFKLRITKYICVLPNANTRLRNKNEGYMPIYVQIC